MLSFSQTYIRSKGMLKSRGWGWDGRGNLFSQTIIMINPFISNNDSNYLFRKNYQFLNKNQPTATSHDYSASKLNFLQSKNPFKPSIIASVASGNPARSLSNSRVGLSSPLNKLGIGKNRLLDEADGWKRELESQQRQKLSAYGAEGLRYNAYSLYSAKPKEYQAEQEENNRYATRHDSKRVALEPQYNDYYANTPKPMEVKVARASRDSDNHVQFHSKTQRKSDKYESFNYQPNPTRKAREQFTDQINQSQIIRPNQPMKRNRHDLQMSPIHQQSRHSGLDDMFGSAIDDRYKQSMHHHSYASYNYNQDLVESKRSKFARDPPQRTSYLVESTVKRLDNLVPATITLFGKTYYRTQL